MLPDIDDELARRIDTRVEQAVAAHLDQHHRPHDHDDRYAPRVHDHGDPDPGPAPSPEPPPDPDPEPAPTPADRNLLGIDLAALPRSGAAYERVRALAAQSPSIRYGDINGGGSMSLLAKALMGDKAGVLATVRAAKASYTPGINSLGIGRTMATTFISLNLVGTHEEDAWVAQVLDDNASAGTYPNFGPLKRSQLKGNNHGSAADCSRVAGLLHLGRRPELEARDIPIIRTRLGEHGLTVDGRPIEFNAPGDATLDEHGHVIVVGPVGYTFEGKDADGLLMEEQRRSAPVPNCGNYNWGGSGQHLLYTWLLSVAGYPATTYADSAARRIFAALKRLGCTPSGDDQWQGALVNRLFGLDYPESVGDGKTLGLTDFWVPATRG